MRTKISFTQYTTLATSKQPLLTATNNLLHPTTVVQPIQEKCLGPCYMAQFPNVLLGGGDGGALSL